MKCEMCEAETEDFVGCYRCGRLVCLDCVAAMPEDEDDEPICEECF
jgi:hypothetical protein